MVTKKIAPVADPAGDVGGELKRLVGDMGVIEVVEGGYRIAVHHSRAFPWDEVFKALLYRDYQVSVTKQKADLYIEAKM